VTNEVELMEVELATGAQRTLTSEKFSDIPRLARLPGGGWLISGSKIPVMNYRVWKVPAEGGEAVPLTQEAELYDGVSLDTQATRMVATQIRYEHFIRFFALDAAPDKPVQLDGDSLDIAPDGKIYFTSWMSGSAEIWSARPDGSNRRQLTNNKWEEDAPIVAPDNGALYFSSIQTGKWFIWRMNLDGSNPKQISFTKGGTPIIVTSDGEWLYFNEHDESTLWRISLKTGEEQLVLSRPGFYGFAVLPDGSQAAFSEKQNGEWVISIVTLPAGRPVKTFSLADKKLYPQIVARTRDGRSLAYVTKNEGSGNFLLWLQALDGGAPRQIAALDNKEMFGRNMPMTPDGKFIAVGQSTILHDAVLLKGLR
jgi:Tol biopolymer transport system component